MIERTVQAIFLIGYAAYEQTRPLPEFIREAAHCLMVCRTAVLGGHKQSCPDGHFTRIWYNSCKHRMCPQCAYLRIQKWLAKQKARILNCDHFHVIFTIPEELRVIWDFNRKTIAQILFTCARDTLFELLGDEKYMGGKPGIIASMHTWTKTMLKHPHIHCLVTGGGLAKSGYWKVAKKKRLLPYGVIRDVFRRHVRKAILHALDKNKLVLPEGMRPQQLKNLLNKLGRKKWNVRICEKYSHGNGVLTYLARYLRGGPIANSRIVAIRNNEVTFNYGRKKRELMTLTIMEFIERYLQHVPQTNAMMVRSYGLYSHTKKAELAKCREILGQEAVVIPEKIDWQSCFQDTKDHPEICPVCGKRLICSGLITPVNSSERHTGDSPIKKPLEQAA